MMKKHYSPGIPVVINQKKHDGKSAYIYIGDKYKNKKDFFSLSKKIIYFWQLQICIKF